jgi:hypothetical protein
MSSFPRPGASQTWPRTRYASTRGAWGRIWWTGDVIHHPFQLACPHLPTNYCTEPAQAAARRVAFCEQYTDTATQVLTAHFPAPSAGRIVRDGSAYAFVFDAA